MWQATKNRYRARDPKRAEGSSAVPTEVLKDFYLKGYEVVRRHCGEEVAVVLHDGFRLEEWEDFMLEPECKNVVIDTHMYVGAGLEPHMESRELADYAVQIEEKFEKALERAQKFHSVVVGEWCIANKSAHIKDADDEEKKRIYRLIGDMQMKAWEKCDGWIFWSYKLHTPGRNDWDFERAVDAGWLVM